MRRISTPTLTSVRLLGVVLIVATIILIGTAGPALAAGQPQNTTTNATNATNTTNTTNTTNATASVAFASGNTTTTSNTTPTPATPTAITVASATLPGGGFVAIHGPAYAEGSGGSPTDSVLAVSGYLAPGTHRNVTLPVGRGVPGASANTSRLMLTRGTLTAVAYRDTNTNDHYDFVSSLGTEDTAYQRHGGAVADSHHVTIGANVATRRARIGTTVGSTTTKLPATAKTETQARPTPATTIPTATTTTDNGTSGGNNTTKGGGGWGLPMLIGVGVVVIIIGVVIGAMLVGHGRRGQRARRRRRRRGR